MSEMGSSNGQSDIYMGRIVLEPDKYRNVADGAVLLEAVMNDKSGLELIFSEYKDKSRQEIERQILQIGE